MFSMKRARSSNRDQDFLNQVSRILGDEQDYSSSVSVQGGDKSARLWVEEETSETRYGIVALGVEPEDRQDIKDVFKNLDDIEEEYGDITLAVEGTVESYNELDEVFRSYRKVKDL